MRNIIERPTRVVFMGTPDFAVPSLRAVVKHAPPARLWASGLDIVGVITRPDKPAGRSRQVAVSPVKQFALERGIPVYQPGSFRQPEALKVLQSLEPDIILVAAFGQILPPAVLELPPHSCLNVHASLLPRWRGASPIAAAILAGDTETGVTIMQMDAGLDTGPILAQRATPIGATETTGALTLRLAEMGANLLVETLPYWLAGGSECREQDDALATMTRPLKKEDGRLDWTRPAVELARQVRADNPWPAAYTTWQGARLKILESHVVSSDTTPAQPGGVQRNVEPSGAALVVACGQGALALDVIQLEGKRALPASDVLRGHPTLAHATFNT